MATFPHTLLLAAPRGFCAGVDRAILIVEKALEAYGPPVYVRHEIVHNTHVVERLRRRGAVFVEDEREIPEGAVAVFSAHGSPPEAYANSRARGHTLIDATCPLVTKVHAEARRYAERGMDIVLVGHRDHQEVVGTTGQAPDRVRVVESADEVEGVEIGDPDNVAYITQTTLSADDTRGVVERLRERFPALHGPRKADICYATQNRQDAIKALADRVDLILVVGSRSSSNSNRLVEVARDHGCAAQLIDDVGQLEQGWIEGTTAVGLSSGASAPEDLVRDVVDWFRRRGTTRVESITVAEEDVDFALPSNLARRLAGEEPAGG